MGLAIASEEFTAEDYRRFSARLGGCLKALKEMLRDPQFGGNVTSWGAELELYLVNSQGRVVDCNEEVLELAADPHFTPELNRFNLEYNSDPVISSASPFTRLQNDFEDALARLDGFTQAFGARPVAIGILPTLQRDNFGPAHMTDLPRYRALTNALQNLGSGQFNIDLDGNPPLQIKVGDVTYEGANTSFQLHYRVSPARFADLYNGLLLATPIVLGMSANSPSLFGHRLWHETRIPLFKHSVDWRPAAGEWRQPARVSLGQGYLRRSAYELFAESVSTQPLVLPVCGNDDYLSQWRAGQPPGLDELRMHQNTVWSWLRPVYDTADGGHLRIELRVLPAGPSVTDMLASAAFYIGLGEAFADRIDDLLPTLPFNYAKYNFYRAAQFGPEAKLVWPNPLRHCLEEQTLQQVAQLLLPLAEEGLQKTGLATQEISRYLSVIAERVANGQTGAVWQLRQMDRLDKSAPVGLEAARTMLLGYMHNQRSGCPVAQWGDL
ncbi:glutamate--cysteine ligase [Aestuariicella hydrocarbonica]|uniref:Glutamate--cysteine ligase n=1 Tax=Pseudomaricurvus hydrocarbonicus TaxID=1470433 RepID=A0A9E5MPA1_9GAMM|nr:glutamate--cysteine ligase [Aestuariicella hydrocarbonica]NHO67812.1 glutamate--cysteine ligase [Aestuariicella hydrocarbonica]